VISEKSPIPTLWLDTSVGIKLAKIRRGESLSDIEVRRGLQLRELIVDLVRNGKLLCPEAGQEEEYEAERIDSEIFAEFARLSGGARMNHRLVIQDAQIYRAMEAHCLGLPQIKLPWRIYFHEDPFRAIEREKGRRLIVSCLDSPDSEFVIRRRAIKRDILQHTEKLRQELVSKGRSYESQLEAELRALGIAMARMIASYSVKLRAGTSDVWDYMGISGFLQYSDRWRTFGKHPRDLYGFLVSDSVTCLPVVKISSQLYADLVTGNQPLLSGDSMDVELLSMATPLAQFVLTDKKMENRVKRLGIDREWGTKVFSMSTVDALFAELAAL
jgi:flagellar biosynthesis regulator FlaF